MLRSREISLFGKGQSLSRRIFLLVLFCSFVALSLSTALQLWLGYRKGVERIQTNVRFIRDSYLPAIATSLYAVDEVQLRLLLKGMLKLEGIVYGRILEKSGTKKFEISEGDAQVREDGGYEFPLTYRTRKGNDVRIGTLSVYPDFSKVYSQLWEQVSINVVSISVMIFIAALLVMFLFQKIVARHLSRMAEFTLGIDLAHLDSKLQLDRTPRQDELEQVAGALNSLQDRLRLDIAERKKAEKALRESEHRYRSLNDNIPVGVFRSKPGGEILSYNLALLQILGIPEEQDFSQMQAGEFYINPEDRQCWLDEIYRDLQVKEFECQLKNSKGEAIWVSISARGIEDNSGRIKYIDGIVEDINSRKMAEEAQRESQKFRKRIFESSMIPIAVMDYKTSAFIDCNPAATSIYRFSSMAETLGKTLLDVSAPMQYDGTPSPEKARYYIEKAITEGMVVFDWRHQRPDGEIWDAEVHLMSFTSGERQLLQFTLKDITERKWAEKEKENLRSQLFQAQKMEAVGHLAGGIAHDFNNMLSVVLGNIELAMMELSPDENIRHKLKDVQDAARRSSNMVRQLLAFARKQTINPIVMDINDTIAGMLKVLRRLIGEDIDLAWIPGHEAHKVKIDPSQIDQILANLLVNAQDAIDGVGRVTIETDSVEIDKAYCAGHAGFVPGSYVMLAVSDNGYGMDRNTLEQIFEPFFTTKAASRGTGLGLATVYGIVKQNNGFINVYSELSEGTTFKIYLPVIETPVKQTEFDVEEQTPPKGIETVLIVEDDEAILMMAQTILSQLGYTVITAKKPDKAIELVQTYNGKIDLLLTDVIMPLMNGRELAERFESIMPGIRCLYMSGYTANVIVHHGVLEDGVWFLPKPFSISDLARKVREALDS
jgi:PAS domain S-box-containing protein